MIYTLIVVLLVIWPICRIVGKTGHSGAWGLLALIPLVNLIALWFFIDEAVIPAQRRGRIALARHEYLARRLIGADDRQYQECIRRLQGVAGRACEKNRPNARNSIGQLTVMKHRA